MKLFHNIYDKFSRDYVEMYGNGVEIISWYGEELIAEDWANVSSSLCPYKFPGILIETSDEMTKAAVMNPTLSSFSSPFVIYPESIDFDLNNLK